MRAGVACPLVEGRVREVLRLVAAHRFVTGPQVEGLVGKGPVAERVLGDLVAAGLVRRVRLTVDGTVFWQVTANGVQALGSVMPLPGFDVGGLRGDVALPWLWLAARGGAFGPVKGLWSRRELAALDGSGAFPVGARGRPVGLLVAGEPAGERHYPDLVLATKGGWVGIYLVLRAPVAGRAEAVFRAYGADVRYAAVLCLVEDHEMAERVAASAASVGLSDLVHVQFAQLYG